MLDRFFAETVGFEPCAGDQVQLVLLSFCERAVQVVAEKLMIAIPLPVIVEPDQKHVALVEPGELGFGVGAAGERVAQRSAKAVENRSAAKEAARLFRL